MFAPASQGEKKPADAACPRSLEPLPIKQMTAYASTDDVRAVLEMPDHLLAATPGGVVRYEKASLRRTLLNDGLRSLNCSALTKDGAGGVWGVFDIGIAYLPLGKTSWIPIVAAGRLSLRQVFDLQVSGDGQRIWVAAEGGIATRRINDKEWRIVERPGVVRLWAHPEKEVVFAAVVAKSGCLCGKLTFVSELTLDGGTWRDIKETVNCFRSGTQDAYYSAETGHLWLAQASSPPILFDTRSGKAKTWPASLHWEVTVDHVHKYSEWFGQMASAGGSEGKMWFATSAGLWRYTPAEDKWQMFTRYKADRTSPALLAASADRRTIVWACSDLVALYDARKNAWKTLARFEQGDRPTALHLTPDARHVWVVANELRVMDLKTAKAVKVAPEGQAVEAVRHIAFDGENGRAYLATPAGIIAAQLDGTSAVRLEAKGGLPGMPVVDMVFSPNGEEVWAVLRDIPRRTSGLSVLSGDRRTWQTPPPAAACKRDCRVGFSMDGKRTWIATGNQEEGKRLFERRSGGNWKSVPADWLVISEVGQILPDSDGKHMWFTTSRSGVWRMDIASGEMKGADQSPGAPLFTETEIVGDHIESLLFLEESRTAVCSGFGNGLSVIDRDTMAVRSYFTGIDNSRNAAMHYGKPVLARDERTVWGKWSDRTLLGFDLVTREWLRKSIRTSGCPLSTFDAIQPATKAGTVWVRGPEGVLVYHIADDKWTDFTGSEWENQGGRAVLRLSQDGKRVIAGHSKGLALFNAGGSGYQVLTLDDKASGAVLTDLESYGDAGGFVFAVRHPTVGGLYYLDMKAAAIRLIRRFEGVPIERVRVDPKGHVWVVTGAAIYELVI